MQPLASSNAQNKSPSLLKVWALTALTDRYRSAAQRLSSIRFLTHPALKLRPYLNLGVVEPEKEGIWHAQISIVKPISIAADGSGTPEAAVSALDEGIVEPKLSRQTV
jgi:hypothetical protein